MNATNTSNRTNPFPRVTVNDEPIPPEAIAHELERLVNFYKQHMPEEQVMAQAAQLRQRAIEQAIGAKLLFMRAAQLDLQVTADELDEKVEELVEQVGGRDKFREVLAKQKMSEAQLRSHLMIGAKVDKLVEKVTSDVADPHEDDIRRHFEQHKDEYQREASIQAQHILIIPANDSPQAKFDAIGKLNEIRKRVLAGADFGDEAAAHSDCPSGKAANGSLGWFSRGMMVPVFDQTAFALGVGELSEVVETEFGFHLIYKNDEEGEVAADFDDVRESIRDFLRHSSRGEAVAAYVAELREKAKVSVE